MQTPMIERTILNMQVIRTDLGLSRERMARLFDVSAKTIERWEVRPDLPASATDRRRLAQLRQIIDLGRLVYSDKGVRLFLSTPAPAFDGLSPLQVIERGDPERVLAALAQDYEGLGT